MDSISDRLRVLVKAKTSDTRRHKEMETATGLPANLWKAWWHEKQRPNEEMIQAVAREWREYAFWLVTGYSDPSYGHEAPGDSGYPTRTTPQPNSRAYFSLVKQCHETAKKAVMHWNRERNGEEWDSDVPISDFLLRASTHLAQANEITAELQQLLKALERAEHLRRAEILLNVEMQKISYDETAALGKTIRALLDKSGISAPDLEKKLQEEMDRFERHLQFQTK